MKIRLQFLASSLLILTLLLAACGTDAMVISTPTPIARYTNDIVTSDIVTSEEDSISIDDQIFDEDIAEADVAGTAVPGEEGANLEEQVGDGLDEEVADAEIGEGVTAEDESEVINGTDDSVLTEPAPEVDGLIAEQEDLTEDEDAEVIGIGEHTIEADEIASGSVSGIETEDIDSDAAGADGGFLDEPIPEEATLPGEEENFTEDEAIAILEDETDQPVAEIEVVELTVIFPDVVTPPGMIDARGILVEASDLLGYNVVNPDGSHLGTLDDLIVDMAGGQLLFATVEYGGLLGLGDRTAPVPLPALRWMAGTSAVAVDLPNRMVAAGGFDDNWPDLGQLGWDSELFATWQQVEPEWIALSQLDTTRFMSKSIIRARELIGKQLLDLEGDQLATVDDLVLNLEMGEVSYLILAEGGLLGIGSRRHAVPITAFDLDLTDDVRQSAFISRAPVEDLQDALPYHGTTTLQETVP